MVSLLLQGYIASTLNFTQIQHAFQEEELQETLDRELNFNQANYVLVVIDFEEDLHSIMVGFNFVELEVLVNLNLKELD